MGDSNWYCGIQPWMASSLLTIHTPAARVGVDKGPAYAGTASKIKMKQRPVHKTPAFVSNACQVVYYWITISDVGIAIGVKVGAGGVALNSGHPAGFSQ
jgi:hypothetical protein